MLASRAEKEPEHFLLGGTGWNPFSGISDFSLWHAFTYISGVLPEPPWTITLSRLTWSHHSMTVHWHCPSLTLPPFFNRRALRMVDRCARACAIYKGPSTSSASPSPQSILTSCGPRKSIQDEVDPPNKSGHVLLGNVRNKVWAALGVLKSMLSTFF